ncbi:hypothetical protein AB4Y45_34610 [Paraburkholderia sp. EG287A]|uniref:hypothetical protein n=1 Tax=Paraburkholderia sp. EG287A TaxID=3237012 RepID=UPI0034D37104
MKHKLTPAQISMLASLAAGRSWDSHISGRSAYGAANATVHKLQSLGLMAGHSITDAGRVALNNTAGK